MWLGNEPLLVGLAVAGPQVDLGAVARAVASDVHALAEHLQGAVGLDRPGLTEAGLLDPATVTTGSTVPVSVSLVPVPGIAKPSGSVTFYQDGARIGAAPLVLDSNGNMTASLNVTALAGSHQVVGVYAGDAANMPTHLPPSNTRLLTSGSPRRNRNQGGRAPSPLTSQGGSVGVTPARP